VNDVPPDDESPIDEWVSTGYRRGVVAGAMLGVACGAVAVGVVAVIAWLTSAPK
jgi:hypothetical protein